MHEFEKTKTGNILALIVAVISFRPFVESLNLPQMPLPYVDAHIEAIHAFSILLLTLALAANFYAFSVIKEEKTFLLASADKLALVFYAISVCLFPFYLIALGSYAAAQDFLGVDFINSHIARVGLFASAAALILFVMVFVPFLKALLRQAKHQKIRDLDREETALVSDAHRMFQAEAFSTSVIRYEQAVVHKLKRALLSAGKSEHGSVDRIVRAAEKAGIMTNETAALWESLKRKVKHAKGHRPVSGADCAQARSDALAILDRIPVK